MTSVINCVKSDRSKIKLQNRNATAAVIGAGDYIGAAIARKFAAEGFTMFAGRRNADKLAPLVAEVEAQNGRIFGRALDARKEAEIVTFLNSTLRSKSASSMSAPMSISHW